MLTLGGATESAPGGATERAPGGAAESAPGGAFAPRNVPSNSLFRAPRAGVQPLWIQGIRRVDGVGVERLVCLLM